jgi:hypothetical protein
MEALEEGKFSVRHIQATHIPNPFLLLTDSMSSWIDTNSIRIPLARALESAEPLINSDEAMKQYGTTCTNGEV